MINTKIESQSKPDKHLASHSKEWDLKGVVIDFDEC